MANQASATGLLAHFSSRTTGSHRSQLQTLLIVLLLISVAVLWIAPLPSSFWMDEMATAFVVRYGASHLSMGPVPQVAASIYYHLPRIADILFGFSEIAY